MNELVELLGADDAPLPKRLASLLRGAAATFKQLAALGTVGLSGVRYPHRRFIRDESGHDRFFAKAVSAIEAPDTIGLNIAGLIQLAGNKPRELPTPAMVRQLRIVTGEIPLLLRPVARSGVGADTDALWRLLWADAMGTTAPKIGKTFGIERNQVWKIRHRAYEMIAQQLAPLTTQRAA